MVVSDVTTETIDQRSIWCTCFEQYILQRKPRFYDLVRNTFVFSRFISTIKNGNPDFLRKAQVFWEKSVFSEKKIRSSEKKQISWEKTRISERNQVFWEKKTGFLRANQVFQKKTRFSESKPGFLRKNKISERKPALLRENLIFYGFFFHGIEYDVLLHRIFLSKHGVLALKRWNSMKPRFWVQNLCFHATWKFKSETESDMD